MTTHHLQLARLQIPPLGSPPVPQSLYTPALPTAIQQNFMHTPLQTNFGQQVPPHPHPRHGLHRAHPSLMLAGPAAALAAAGIAPPSGMPVTPVGIPPHLLGGPGFQRGSRRTPSMSLGGPPKAPLGGPNAKHSAMPAVTSSNVPSACEKSKSKKVILKLPVESVVSGENEGDERLVYSLWSRRPLAHSAARRMDDAEPPDITSMERHPIEQSNSLPSAIDVFLPGKTAWDEYIQKVIDEKLQRLGVERGGSSAQAGQPHIHSRAASISSPADPALLLFKLNKLQKSQTGPISVSPQPPSIPVSPNPPLPPRFQNATSRHGHSFSLANFTTPPPLQPQFHHPSSSFNPFGPGATLGSDQVIVSNPPSQQRDPPPHLHAPQGVVPLSLNMQSDTTTASSGPSRVASTVPDFNRGFGLDIPEEDEEIERDDVAGGLLDDDVDGEMNQIEDDSTTAPAHSRHVSRVSVALSLKSMGGRGGNLEVDESIEESAPPELQNPINWNLHDVGSDFEHAGPGTRGTEADLDPIGEWTASEDERTLEEYSNPSDEERALQVRQVRREQKARQRSYQDQETPRRLPDFPRPPEGGPNLAHYASSTADEDIVSNPSEEGKTHVHNAWLHPPQHHQDLAQYQPVIDGRVRSPRPLPPLPHSRTASGNHSLHSARMHSRHGSSIVNETDPSTLLVGTTGQPARRESLNPFAKPFVFGAVTFASKVACNSPTEDLVVGHNLQQSLGRALNAAAAEFKPTGFTFRPPEGVPLLSFNAPDKSRPLPQGPVGISPSRFQGREKRQRHGSSVENEIDGEEEKDIQDMNSFRFPQGLRSNGLHSPPVTVLREISPLPRRKSDLNASAPPFKFPGTGFLSFPFERKESSTLPYPLVPARARTPITDMQTQSEPGATVTPDVETKEISSETAASVHPSPSPARKRPPVLDFKHPVSTNTVPAALFRKALVGTDMDGPTRASVQSRLSSRDIFEHVNSPSLDDRDVPTISRRSNVPHPHITSALQDRPDIVQGQPIDIFAPVSNGEVTSRGQSLQILRNATVSPVADVLYVSDIKQHEEDGHMEQRLEDLLDSRWEVIKKDILEAQTIATGQVVGQVVTAIRSHISELVMQRLDDGTTDARKDDFELVRNALEHGVMDIRTGLRRDLEEVLRSVESANISRERLSSGVPIDFQRIMEDFGNRTVSAVTNAVVKFASRIDQIDEFARVRAADERGMLLGELFNLLAPRLESFRQQPMDFDIVTAKLAEAVKPHISQLIDLTSDKKETAGLIVQRLMPTLSALSQTPAQVDTDAIISQLRVEVARMAPASDPHAVKEAVADLVVERLDSRLAVREKSAASGEHLYSRISERIDDLHVPVSDVRKAVEDLRMGQESIREQGAMLNTLHQDMAAQLLSLPGDIQSTAATIQAIRDKWVPVENGSAATDFTQMSARLESIESMLHGLATDRQHLASQAAGLISLHEDLKNYVSTLPQSFIEATSSLRQGQAELLSRSRTPDQSNEVRNLLASNAELQVQIAKARGAHGQIRVEKDLMSDRMVSAERERDNLRTQLEELKSNSSARDTEVTTAGLRITELEDALSHSLARLKASDVTAQAKDERIAALERQNRDFGLDQHQLKSQIQKLELQSEWLARDKDTLEQRLLQLQKDHDSLANQQSHWEELRRTSEQVEQLTRLIGAAGSEEVAELKRERDRCKVLEGEYTSLQKRFKEHEVKFASLDRSAQMTRQSLVQTQERASEWEKRTKELQTELDATRARLDDADETKLQLDSDISLAKMHLEEKEVAEKAAQERETNLCAEVSSLEAHVASLKAELAKSKPGRFQVVMTARSASGSSDHRVNGHTTDQDARPPSRASTVYGGRSPVTPTDLTYRTPHASSARPDGSKGVWDSMHAPRAPTHRSSSTLPYSQKSTIPSPTPSTVSLAPTQGEDGWWS